VLGNDEDVDGNPLQVVRVSDPTHGSLSLSANGSFIYTPQANFTGTDSFTYKAYDGATDSNEAIVTITVVDSPTPTITATLPPTATDTPTDIPTDTFTPEPKNSYTPTMTDTPTSTPTSTPPGCDLVGDLNQDGAVDVLDLTIVSTCYGLNEGDSGYNPVADTVPNGTINLFDLMFVAQHYGENCGLPSKSSLLEENGAISTVTLLRPIASDVSPGIGAEIEVVVQIENVSNLSGFQFSLVYDPTQLELLKTTEGTFLSGENGEVEHFFYRL